MPLVSSQTLVGSTDTTVYIATQSGTTTARVSVDLRALAEATPINNGYVAQYRGATVISTATVSNNGIVGVFTMAQNDELHAVLANGKAVMSVAAIEP